MGNYKTSIELNKSSNDLIFSYIANKYEMEGLQTLNIDGKYNMEFLDFIFSKFEVISVINEFDNIIYDMDDKYFLNTKLYELGLIDEKYGIIIFGYLSYNYTDYDSKYTSNFDEEIERLVHLNNITFYHDTNLNIAKFEEIIANSSSDDEKLDSYETYLGYLIKSKELLEEIYNATDNFLINPVSDCSFFTIVQTEVGLDLEPNPIDKLDVNIEMNYNDDCVTEYEYILDKLTNTSSGLVLFSGEPGTGKSSLIMKLIGDMHGKKDIVYLYSTMVDIIGTPSFMSFIKELKNSILVIEDAEGALLSRDGHDNFAVSNILNITSGLLNKSLGIQVVATFNTKLSNIDQALLRSGRLIKHYVVDKLEATKATKLSEELGFNLTYKQPATLADVYNGVLKEEEVNKIGF